MKITNGQKLKMGLKERLIQIAGNHLAQMAVSPRECFILIWYEPELSPEMVEEMFVD